LHRFLCSKKTPNLSFIFQMYHSLPGLCRLCPRLQSYSCLFPNKISFIGDLPPSFYLTLTQQYGVVHRDSNQGLLSIANKELASASSHGVRHFGNVIFQLQLSLPMIGAQLRICLQNPESEITS
jgi:hypothetical protein